MAKRVKVLAFIDWYKPGYLAGGTITAFGNFVDYLELDFDFKIVTRDNDYLSTNSYQSIKSNHWNKLSRTIVYYLSKEQVTIEQIRKLIKTTEYDIIYINGVFSLYFSILPLIFTKNKKCFVNPHGMFSEQAFSIKGAKKKIFLTIANFLGLYKNAIFHVANQEEADAVKKRISSFKDIKISNQLPRPILQELRVKPKNEIARFVNVARISFEKGTLKMIKAFQHVKSNVVLDIYGPIYDEDYWNECQEIIKLLPQNITITYKGSVASKAIPAILQQYDFFVLLSEGENFGHAILEGLSAGLPIIISDQTPWRNLESKGIGWDIQNESSKIPEIIEFASSMSNENYDLMSQNSFKFAKEFCENSELVEANKNLFKT